MKALTAERQIAVSFYYSFLNWKLRIFIVFKHHQKHLLYCFFFYVQIKYLSTLFHDKAQKCDIARSSVLIYWNSKKLLNDGMVTNENLSVCLRWSYENARQHFQYQAVDFKNVLFLPQISIVMLIDMSISVYIYFFFIAIVFKTIIITTSATSYIFLIAWNTYVCNIALLSFVTKSTTCICS